LLRITDVTLRRGARVLLENASLVVHPGHKVGLVGPNGAGKSSLFALIRGELHADAGDVAMPPRWVISHVAQETESLERPALEFVMDGDEELRELEAAMDPRPTPLPREREPTGDELAQLHARFDEIGGYTARSRAQRLLAGLGFREEAHELPVATFSGGWRMRLNLARALMCRSDLLLLDEPTNHLDLDAVLWLEDWLGSFPGALLLITHDREFLDAVAKTIVHLDRQRLDTYSGNYSDFEAQRASRLALQASAYEKQQRTIAHLESFITRFRAKATKARQAQSRIRALEKMERIAAAHVDKPFEFSFRSPPEKPHQLLRMEDAVVGHGGKAVIEGIEWSVLPGDAIGLLGPNGAGKSTLLKSVVGELPLLAGEIHRAQGLRIGYFAQHQVEQLRLDETPLWHLQKIATGEREQSFRDFLGGFDIRGDSVAQKVASFSGGEKARLALALIVWQRPNLLLLDEPTNHLDIEMREALAEALVAFEGALVVVAHDRHLLAATTDQWLLVADGKLQAFEGDLDDYKEWVKQRQVGGRRSEVGGESATSRKDVRRIEAAQRQREANARKPFEKKLAAIEAELEPLQSEAREIETWLASEEAYVEASRERLQATLKRRGEVAARIATLEDDWLWAQAEMDRVMKEAAPPTSDLQPPT
jgi:ATP-binding cassette subfamily F protein 3